MDDDKKPSGQERSEYDKAEDLVLASDHLLRSRDDRGAMVSRGPVRCTHEAGAERGKERRTTMRGRATDEAAFDAYMWIRWGLSPDQAAETRVTHLRVLEDGWDGEGAPAPSATAIDHASTALGWLNALLERIDPNGTTWADVDLDPDVLGGVSICVGDGCREARISLKNSGDETLVLTCSGPPRTLEAKPWNDAARSTLANFLSVHSAGEVSHG